MNGQAPDLFAEAEASASPQKMTARELVERLRRHYIKPGPMPGGIFIAECGLNGGFGSSQRVDAVHVGFTSSSGRILTGHEIKVSRGDWLHELDQPGKADLWADQCHAWYLVTPRDLVKPEEVPHDWGLMVPSSRTTTRMDIVVRATVHADRTPSWTIVRSIMARYDTLRAQAIEDDRQKHDREKRLAIDAARREFAAKNGAVSDGTVERVASIIRRVEAETRDTFVNVADDDVVTALVDVVRARALAQELRYSLRETVRSAESVAKPFAHAYGELAKLLADVTEAAGGR